MRTSAKSRLISAGLTIRSAILFEDLVRDAECFYHRRVFGYDAGDFIVRDDDQRIDVFFQIFQPLHRVVHTFFAFEIERLGNDGDGKDLEIARDLGDDGSGSRTRTAAHTGRYEQKVGVFDRFGEHLFALFRSRAPHFRLRASAEPLRKGRTDLNFVFRFGEEQDLLIGIHRDVTCALNARFDHAVDRIASGAADADHLDSCYPRQTV